MAGNAPLGVMGAAGSKLRPRPILSGDVYKPLVTQPGRVRGWSVGQPITNLTREGRVPTWATVRRRYWMNEAAANPLRHTPRNLERLTKGLAPQHFDEDLGRWISKELHHRPAQRDGGLFDFIEVWPEQHRKIDDFRR